ncbi:MAG: hypothetical protein A3F84_04830 [Candidatus Handelsmanbacteria bacterium RIFCSPLOWO2_12_FULL_64_10]|uniref:Phage holin family protein n=1 Tax=Handelsmanbacteria sp. (strain RIFCSPLOWO2_12_FULL_64_10) TaxID=1817868 RepID=A0A1F6CXT8_HANXR|nr:MAG: hypothetical protein A3F84_04830 [Candidatus Handelsmanbacteria bacterium RIFCSPLOWO2_12_FULL_64_10]
MGNDSKNKKPPTPLTREDLAQIAAEADARMGRVAQKVRAVLVGIVAALMVVLAATLYLGLIAVASILIAVCLITVTLYLFVRLWPGAGPAARPSPIPPPTPEATPAAVDAAPRESRYRVLWALRAMARRQDDFLISGRAAERFARTIRFILKGGK